MLSVLAVLLLVHTERLNVHGLSNVGQYMAGGRGKGPAEVVGKWVQRRLELMLEDSQEQGALGFTTAAGHPGTNPPPWSQEFTVELFRCLHLHIYIPDALKINFAL